MKLMTSFNLSILFIIIAGIWGSSYMKKYKLTYSFKVSDPDIDKLRILYMSSVDIIIYGILLILISNDFIVDLLSIEINSARVSFGFLVFFAFSIWRTQELLSENNRKELTNIKMISSILAAGCLASSLFLGGNLSSILKTIFLVVLMALAAYNAYSLNKLIKTYEN